MNTTTGWVKPARSLATAAGRAIGDYRMIREGDRILLGLSGGKDSLSLLHTLHHLQQKAPVKFGLLACTVDPQSDQYDPSPLTPYLAELGVPYFLESQPIMVEAQKTLTKDSDSYCAYCSRMRRGILYRVAREQNCNVVAMAHHLGLEVIAEGVETREAWNVLTTWGCDRAQGFYAASPRSAQELVDWLRSRWPEVA